MWLALGSLAFVISAQIPPPATGPSPASNLKSERREILRRENEALSSLAEQLEQNKQSEIASAVRKLVVTPTDSDALIRFIPVPEVSKVGEDPSAQDKTSAKIDQAHQLNPSKPPKSPEATHPSLEKIRKQTANELLDLARRAYTASPPQWGLASLCVRDALEHNPDDAEARRLLGFEPYEGGWARPFAITQLKADRVIHPTFGWVPSSWVSHLDSGELPAPSRSRTSPTRWLAADEADRLRVDGNPPWYITTEHFEIRSNVPLSRTIAFGRKLESFYDLFYTVMADVIASRLPLARRLADSSLHGEKPSPPHVIYFFATKKQYLDHIQRFAPKGIESSLGYYDPFGPGTKTRKPAYFFLDEGGRIDTTATLYHEVSHQLLFEAGVGKAYKINVGNYWVFEGLGALFETVVTRPDGAMEVGGFIGPRIEAAIQQFAGNATAMPTGLFVGLSQDVFNLEPQIYTNYQQGMALAMFLMRWHDGAYRDAFLDYVADGLKGTLRPNRGRSLEDRLGIPYETIDAEFQQFLKEGSAALRLPRQAEPASGAKPITPGS